MLGSNETSGRVAGVGIFGAFERHNFGDWLMGFCAEQALTDFQVSWLVDFPSVGLGIPRESANFVPLETFLESNEHSSVIHVGGETLACTPGDASHMSGFPDTHSKRPLHYVLPAHLDGNPIRRSFFAVGGTQIDSLDEETRGYLKDSLSTAVYVSVRDGFTKAKLAEIGVNAVTTPDLVAALPLLHKFEGVVSPKKKLVFQANVELISQNEEEIAKFLFHWSKYCDEVWLVAAGVAPGHDSWFALQRLKLHLAERFAVDAKVLFSLNPLEIAEVISKAWLVVATSLHFRILAMSFGVPRVSIGVPKVRAYASTWDIKEFFALNFHNLNSTVENSLEVSKERLVNFGSVHSALARESWLKMVTELA